MPSPALAPLPRPVPPPARGDAPPVRAVRVPLSRPIQHHPTGRVTGRSLFGSLAAHALLLALAAWALASAPARFASRATGPAEQAGAAGGGGDERVSYLEMGAWPGAEVASGGVAALATGDSGTLNPDSLAASTLPALPSQVPTGIPAAPRAPSAAPGTGRGAAPGPATGPATGGGAPSSGAGPGAGPGRGPGAPGAGTGGTGGVLRPGYVDPRLEVKPGSFPPPRPLTDIERYREHLQARIDELNTAEGEEAEHLRRIHNWTWKDGKGREWGIGDGGVPVVAGRRIPTAVLPPIPRDRDHEDAAREAARRRGEIDRQAADYDRQRHLRERIRATRARQDSIRNARKRDEKKP